jgi:hypothetical protein
MDLLGVTAEVHDLKGTVYSKSAKINENRLTASNFGKVINRKSAPSVKFLNNLFKIKNIYAPSLDYGKRHESVAKGKYLEKNRENHFHECGFVVNKSFSFLGATQELVHRQKRNVCTKSFYDNN